LAFWCKLEKSSDFLKSTEILAELQQPFHKTRRQLNSPIDARQDNQSTCKSKNIIRKSASILPARTDLKSYSKTFVICIVNAECLYMPSAEACHVPTLNPTLSPPLEQSPPAGHSIHDGHTSVAPANGTKEYFPRGQNSHTPLIKFNPEI
jgi:hypothetical protein